MRTVPIREIMTTKVITATPDEPLSRIDEKFRLFRIRHVPVVNAQKKLLGVITQRDLFHLMAPRKTEDGDYYDPAQLNTYNLEKIMTHDPLSLHPEDSIARAVEIMAATKYGCLPVVDQGNTLVGIITQIDILKFFAQWLKQNT